MSHSTGYVLAHRRIYRERGRASGHTCSYGQQASHWAYQHQAEVELLDGKQPYSDDPADYEAMCVCCHKQFDLEVKYARLDIELGY